MAQLQNFIQASDRFVALESRIKLENQTIESLDILISKVLQVWEEIETAYYAFISQPDSENSDEPSAVDRATVEEKYQSVFYSYAMLVGSLKHLRSELQGKPKSESPPSSTQNNEPTVTANVLTDAPRTEHLGGNLNGSQTHLQNPEHTSYDSHPGSPFDTRNLFSRLMESTGLHRPLETHSHNLPLPPCDIETFNSTYSAWPSFRDMFSAVVIQNSRLSNVEKLFHLRNKTKGEAKEIVSRVPLTHDGFTLAWNQLSSMYEDKRVLVNSQLKNLFNLSVVSKESSRELKQLLRNINTSVYTLNTHNISTSDWDPILVFLCCQRLPENTIALWEQSLLNKTAIPTWRELAHFLTLRAKTLDSISETRNASLLQTRQPAKSHLTTSEVTSSTPSPKISTSLSRRASKITCPLCPRDKHNIRGCEKFKSMSYQERWNTVTKFNLCSNCLSSAHTLGQCSSAFHCGSCTERHHTKLHNYKIQRSNNAAPGAHGNNIPAPSASTSSAAQNNENPRSFHQHRASISTPSTRTSDKTVLLGTANVLLHHLGTTYQVRALLDSGSEVTCISKSLRKRLGLPTKAANISLLGVNSQVTAYASELCQFSIGPTRDRNMKIECSALVLPRISGNLPTVTIKWMDNYQLPLLPLADANFHKSSTVDFLIGADLYPCVMRSGVQFNVLGSLIAQETAFGWILTGTLHNPHFTSVSMDYQLRKFWEIEEIPKKKVSIAR